MTLPLSDEIAQSLRAKAGTRLARNLATIINEVLNDEQVYARFVPEVRESSKMDSRVNELYEYAKLPVQCPCDPQYAMELPKTHLMVYDVIGSRDNTAVDRILLATLICDVSLHSREGQALFWAQAMSKFSPGKFVFVTEDIENELAPCENGNKARRLLETIMDRAYLVNTYTDGSDLTKDIAKFKASFNMIDSRILDDRRKSGMYCPKVQPLDRLLYDLKSWRDEARSRRV